MYFLSVESCGYLSRAAGSKRARNSHAGSARSAFAHCLRSIGVNGSSSDGTGWPMSVHNESANSFQVCQLCECIWKGTMLKCELAACHILVRRSVRAGAWRVEAEPMATSATPVLSYPMKMGMLLRIQLAADINHTKTHSNAFISVPSDSIWSHPT